MTMVPYATTCDAHGCGKRSDEYAHWPPCRECHGDTCPEHTAPGSTKEHSRDRSYGDYTEAEEWTSVLCLECAKEGEEE